MNNNLSSSFSLSPSAFRLLSLFRRLVFVCCCCCCLSVSPTCKHGRPRMYTCPECAFQVLWCEEDNRSKTCIDWLTETWIYPSIATGMGWPWTVTALHFKGIFQLVSSKPPKLTSSPVCKSSKMLMATYTKSENIGFHYWLWTKRTQFLGGPSETFSVWV